MAQWTVQLVRVVNMVSTVFGGVVKLKTVEKGKEGKTAREKREVDRLMEPLASK